MCFPAAIKAADMLHAPLRFPMQLVTHFLLLRHRDCCRWQCPRQVDTSLACRTSAAPQRRQQLQRTLPGVSLGAPALGTSSPPPQSHNRHPPNSTGTWMHVQTRACVRPCDMTCVNMLVYKSTSAAPPMSAQDRVARKWASFSCKASHQRGCAPPAAEP